MCTALKAVPLYSIKIAKGRSYIVNTTQAISVMPFGLNKLKESVGSKVVQSSSKFVGKVSQYTGALDRQTQRRNSNQGPEGSHGKL